MDTTHETLVDDESPPPGHRPVYIHTGRRRNSNQEMPTAPYLAYINEDDVEQQFTLNKDTMTIGRKDGNDIVLNFINISKKHAVIERSETGWLIKDNNSANGVLLNNVEIFEPATLHHGDLLKLGTVHLRFIDEANAGETEVAQRPPISSNGRESGDGIPPVNWRRSRMSNRSSRAWRSTMLPSPSSPRLMHRNTHRITILPSEKKYEDSFMVREAISTQEDTDFLPASEIVDMDVLKQDYEKLRLAYGLSKLGVTDDLEQLCHYMLDLLFSVLAADRAVILLMDHATNSLVKYLSRTRDADDDQEILLSYTILQQVYRDKTCMITADAFHDPMLNKAASIAVGQIRSAMCVPLVAHDSVQGVLHLDSRSKVNAFSKKDLALVRAIANQAAVSIHNALLLQDIEDQIRMRETLGRFLPPHVMQKSVEKGTEGDLLTSGGRNMIGTILFVDIRGFTRFSESLPPQEVVNLLNDFFERITNIIFAHDGVIDKFIGDCLMATFGTLEEEMDPVYNAVAAALEFASAVKNMNEGRVKQNKEAIAIGTGINTGPLTAGFIGSARRMEYTCIGDTVNTASRICSKAEAGEVLISESTYEAVKDRIDAEFLGMKSFKGKTIEVPCYRAISKRPF